MSARNFDTKTPCESPSVVGVLLLLGPYAILAIVALTLLTRWDAIPARFAVHWGLDGRPNGWSTRSFGGVFGPILFAAALCAALALLRLLPRQSMSRRMTRAVALISSYAIATAVGLSALHPGEQPNHKLVTWGIGIPATLAAVVGIAIIARGVARDVAR